MFKPSEQNSSFLPRNVFRKVGLLFLFFFLIAGFSFGQTQQTTVPSYNWFGKQDLALVAPSGLTVNSDDIIISVATDPDGNVYTLSFGKGVNKWDSNGNLLKSGFISSNELDSPLDMAIDENGDIYIADYFAGGDTFADNGKIRVFDPQGNPLSSRTILTSFYRPIGVDIDSENVYVAEYNDGKQGPEPDPMSRVQVFNKSDKTIVASTQNVEIPYRIAVDSQKNIYVSQAGNNNPQVLVFDSDLKNPSPLPNITSGGSVVVDKFDFIHVLEYGTRVDFEQFLNYDKLGPFEALALYNQIKAGIDNNEFKIKIFNSSGVLVKTLTDNAANDLNIEFPVDLAFNRCNRMYTNNANTVSNYGLDFDLEIYERSPSLDTEPPVIQCPSDINVQAEPGKNYATVSFSTPAFTDNCSATIEQTKGLASNSQFPVGETPIEFTATDAAGNSEVCSFKVVVSEGDISPEFQSCSSDLNFNNDPGKCGAIVTFPTPTASDENGSVPVIRTDNGPPSGALFPVGSTTVKFSATDDQGNTSYCEFTITVTDNETPTISVCPNDKSESFDPNTGFTVPNYRDLLQVSDNCTSSSDIIIEQNPLPGTVINQSTDVIFKVKDQHNNINNACSFYLELTEETPLEVTCPGDQQEELQENCSFKLPDYTGMAQVNKPGASISQDPVEGTEITGEILVTLTATLDGETDSCTFKVSPVDTTAPVVSCPGNQNQSSSNGQAQLDDYTNLVQVSDNCSVSLSQSPSPGTTISSDIIVEITATDASGNNNSCSFQVSLVEGEVPLEITCPGDQQEELQENCSFKLPNYSGMAQVNKSGASISQDPVEGTEITAETLVTLTASLNGETASCTFKVIPTDTTDPVLVCPADQTQASTNGEARLDNYKDLVQVSDNCSVSLSQSPAAGTTITSATTVNITATDASGNTSSCSFQVSLIEGEVPLKIECPGDQLLDLGENCQVSLPDYTSLAGVTNKDAVVSQSPPANTLIDQDTTVILEASLNGETDACAFDVIVSDNTPPQVSCVGTLDIDLDAASRAEITPEMLNSGSSDNCEITAMSLDQTVFGEGDIGENSVVLTVTDAAGNVSTCTSTVNVHAYNPNPDFTCLGTYSLELDENGVASLAPSDLYEGNAGSVVFSLDRTSFSCADIGEVVVTLSYSGNGLEESCEIKVEVSDKMPPELHLQGAEVFLDETGNANISPEDLDAGTTDNCSEDLSWTANKTNFDCESVGPNIIEVTVKDAAGNTNTGNVTVFVNPNPEACDTTQPEDTFDYLFIYPNPNAGEFSIYAPEGVSISKVNAFDVRGRLIREKVFETGAVDYQVDLGSVRQAVYILQIITNEGEVIRRVIIKN